MGNDFIKDFENLFDFEEISYFYHITSKNNIYSILEKGLLMANKKWISTMIQITPEMINNPINFINEEKGNGIREKTAMIIIGCPTESVNSMVKIFDYKTNTWGMENDTKYFVTNSNILSAIDMEKYEIIYNENYQYNNSFTF